MNPSSYLNQIIYTNCDIVAILAGQHYFCSCTNLHKLRNWHLSSSNTGFFAARRWPMWIRTIESHTRGLRMDHIDLHIRHTDPRLV
ncbi:hypothetical protein ACHAXS_002243 [Conticribra weissflogii]